MLRKKQVFQMASLLLGLYLAACSAHVSGGDGPAPVDTTKSGFMDTRATIQGPGVEGHWISACARRTGTNSYRQFDVSFAGNTVTRNEQVYSDSHCSMLTNSVSYHGRFRFIEKFSDGSFNIEYAFALGNGVTTYPQENILTSNGQLYLSDFVTGSMATVLKNEPLNLVGGPSTTKPTTNKPAIQVSSYAAAKFAFCSTQRRGVLVDFMGADLSKSGTGQARLGTKVCGSTSEVKWNPQPSDFVVNVVNGQPQITFPASTYGDRIKPYSYQNGLIGGQGANSAIAGNSGECFFTSNDGTQNLPFIYDCN